MDSSLSALWGLVGEIVTDPRGGARRILAARVTMQARWLALALVVVLSVLLGQITLRLLVAPAGMMGAMLSGTASSILLQAGVLMLMAVAAHQVGRWMGGHGTFPDAMLLIACLQGVMVLVQVVQIAALLLLPPLAGMVSVLALAMFLWVLTGFVAELHGFRSRLAVLGMVVVTAFGVAFLLALVLAMLGITPPATA